MLFFCYRGTRRESKHVSGTPIHRAEIFRTVPSSASEERRFAQSTSIQISKTSFLSVGPAFPAGAPGAPVCLRGRFINKDIDTAGKDLNGGDAKNRREDIALPRASERKREQVNPLSRRVLSKVWIARIFFLFFFFAASNFIINPIPRSRKNKYPKRCIFH